MAATVVEITVMGFLRQYLLVAVVAAVAEIAP